MKTNIERGVTILIILWLTGVSFTIYAQSEKKFIRQGNGLYNENKFSESEVAYRKAIDKNNMSSDAGFNLGDALFRQKKYEDAGKQFLENSSAVASNTKKSASLYNLGNSLLNANKIQESIQAYKNSLKLNPGSKEAKYNLAYAQDLLKLQQKQQQQQKDQKDNKKEDQKKDQNKEQNKDQNKDQNKNQDNKQNQNQKDQQQQQQQGISKEDAQRLLNAIANDEKNVQEKVKLAKAAQEKVRTLRNW
jgi:Ca-activated chloride channel homolog